MAEYIEREAALEIAMQYCPDDDGSCSKAGLDLREMLDEIEAVPAADVVPVVRCGECENWQSDWKSETAKDGTHFCANVGFCTSSDWFCAGGVRKDGDGE